MVNFKLHKPIPNFSYENWVKSLYIVSFFPVLLRFIDIQHCISLRCTAQWFDLHMSWHDDHNKFSEHPLSHIDIKLKQIIRFVLLTIFIYNIQ